MTMQFNGSNLGLGNLSRLSHAQTRSISAENPNGEKGKGGMAIEGAGAHASAQLGQGWKVSPCVHIAPHTNFTMAHIQGSGAIQQIWLTTKPEFWRASVLRMYWDGEENPSVETPLGDFFCNGWAERCNVTSLAVCVNPAGGFNSYWEMPFRKSARVMVENLADEPMTLYY